MNFAAIDPNSLIEIEQLAESASDGGENEFQREYSHALNLLSMANGGVI